MALFNNNCKVNDISQGYTKKLGLKVWKINIGTQKIDGSALETFVIVITNF